MKRSYMVGISIISGCLAAVCVFLYGMDLQAQAEEQRKEMLALYGSDQLEVCVATRDILPGEALDSSNTSVQIWPVELLVQGALRSLDDVKQQPAVVPIFKGEVLSTQHFEAEKDTALQVPVGMCAISVPSKEVSAVGGSIAKGSRVDVYITGVQGTHLLASELVVLSTSKEVKEDAADITWITLAVKPEQVEEFVSAAQKSELYFTLPASKDELQTDDAPEEVKDDAIAGSGKDEDAAKTEMKNPLQQDKQEEALDKRPEESGVEVIERLSDSSNTSKEHV